MTSQRQNARPQYANVSYQPQPTSLPIRDDPVTRFRLLA
ncbi:hypothetical protein NK6_4584 [Bradyrhizobium diazoefficiens]|uniref:Uncharacterized protein n=1 Tax=Bradyrhizobium diazoefficiens TaxID=1355477 RepID=A0A0E4BQY5_9BRAD|nr:hypothetical protein NK6_4584 [Bradyrhizobium diazoefficiens]